MDTYGLIGFPLGHSFSAGYFSDKFEREGIASNYLNFPMEDVSEARALPLRHPKLKGLNVTIPHKKAVIEFLDELDPVARELGAVNTIRIHRRGDAFHMKGFNTDVVGFERSLREHLEEGHRQALVLGTGGSSMAVCHVLKNLGITYRQVSRQGGGGDKSDGRLLSYGELNGKLVSESPLIINTTPLGMHPKVDACPDLPYKAMGPGHLLFDLVYNPAETLFLRKGKELGAATENGYNMLVYQAEASWNIWNT